MSSLFISVNDTFDIVVYAFMKDGDLNATTSEKDVPPDVEPETVKIVFRKPTNKDAVTLSSASIKTSMDGAVQVDVIKMQDYVLRNLIVSWDLKDGENAVPVNPENIDKLNPILARVISSEALNKIKI